MKKIIWLLALLATTASASPKVQNPNVAGLTDIQSAYGIATGNISSSTACLTSLAFSARNYASLSVGNYVYDATTGANIGSGVTIAGLPGTCSANQVQISANGSGTASGDTIYFGGPPSALIHVSKLWDDIFGQLFSTTLGQFFPSQTGNSGKFLQSNGTSASWQNATAVFATPVPTIITSGSGTYTVPGSTLYLEIWMAGGGGGTGGAGSSSGGGSSGGSTTFGTSTAAGGVPASGARGGMGGGAFTLGSGYADIDSMIGPSGFTGTQASAGNGGQGGWTPFGGGGIGGNSGINGGNADPNTGGGGGGGYASAGCAGGGQAGAWMHFIIPNGVLGSSYSWSVGTGGTGGAAGGGGTAGGNGADGKIVVLAHNQ